MTNAIILLGRAVCSVCSDLVITPNHVRRTGLSVCVQCRCATTLNHINCGFDIEHPDFVNTATLYQIY